MSTKLDDEHEPVAWKLDEQGWLEVEQDEAGVLLVIHLSPSEVQRLHIDLTRAQGSENERLRTDLVHRDAEIQRLRSMLERVRDDI